MGVILMRIGVFINHITPIFPMITPFEFAARLIGIGNYREIIKLPNPCCSSFSQKNKHATAKGGEVACGAAGGDRTHDPWLRRPILYPLSYSRIKEAGIISRDVLNAPCHGGEIPAFCNMRLPLQGQHKLIGYN